MRRLNDQRSEVIEEEILKENPEGLPDKAGIVVAKIVPKYRKIEFVNGRDPGYALDFHYHSKTHPLKHYTLYHGMIHELPEEIIEHLEDVHENIYAYKTGANGHPEMYVKSHKYVFQCKNANRRAA